MTTATQNQMNRLSQDFSEIAGEEICAEKINGTYYGYGSELGCLRLYANYTANGCCPSATAKFRVGFSCNLHTHFFAIEN